MKTLIKNGLVYTKDGFEKLDIIFDHGKIQKIDACLKNESVEKIIDAKNLIVSSGFVDLHVHLREPGFSYKETIATGTLSAIKGGFTSVCAMPNVEPVPDNYENLKKQLDIIQKSANCKVFPYMSLTKNREGKEAVKFLENVVGYSDDGNSVNDDKVMEKILKRASEKDILIIAHCEDKNKILNSACINEGNFAKKNNFVGISSKSEYSQLKRDLKFVKKYNARYHMCHISTKESVELIRKAKKEGLKVTCEVTPHHACLCEDDLIDDGKFKMAPPLRSYEDKESILEGMIDKTIDCIATDHAPHAVFEKNLGLKKSLMGVVGLECAFSVLFTYLCNTGKMSKERLLYMMTFSPSSIIEKGSKIALGENADITIIDPNCEWIIDSEKFASKGRSTPFDGKKVKSMIVMTIVNGKVVHKR